MKKLILFAILLLGANIASAQINKGNVMVGTEISNLNVNFNNQTAFRFTPKAAWFVQDGLAIGAYGLFGVTHVNGQDGSSYTWGVGPLARYFLTSSQLPAFGQAKFFVEGNVGIQGVNNTVNNAHTNGLGFGFGPGISYFLTPSVGLEALIKYEGIVGFGSNTYNNGLSFGIGFQIYLPSQGLMKDIKEIKEF